MTLLVMNNQALIASTDHLIMIPDSTSTLLLDTTLGALRATIPC